jgi:hypothetical protein
VRGLKAFFACLLSWQQIFDRISILSPHPDHEQQNHCAASAQFGVMNLKTIIPDSYFLRPLPRCNKAAKVNMPALGKPWQVIGISGGNCYESTYCVSAVRIICGGCCLWRSSFNGRAGHCAAAIGCRCSR